MNYYNEIKNELINNEINRKVKNPLIRAICHDKRIYSVRYQKFYFNRSRAF